MIRWHQFIQKFWTKSDVKPQQLKMNNHLKPIEVKGEINNAERIKGLLFTFIVSLALSFYRCCES